MLSETSMEKRKADCNPDAVDKCIIGIQRQDSGALEEFYHRTSASVYGFALSVLKNTQDAEDIMHDFYVLVWSAADKYRPGGKPMAWVLTVTRNLCLQKIREYGKKSDIPQEDWENYISGNPNMTAEDRVILSECLKSLSDEERQIVMLHAVSGFKHREIARLLEMPLSTVLSKYNRAMKKLRKIYGGEQ